MGNLDQGGALLHRFRFSNLECGGALLRRFCFSCFSLFLTMPKNRLNRETKAVEQSTTALQINPVLLPR
jgi:hypothetical protein